ncbi:DUF167 domain-containing protein [Candidatus Saccharibacteria bacterium]|nr:DUF167 domain-containing protein [Candidatus Saccharibacteria bacterium]
MKYTVLVKPGTSQEKVMIREDGGIVVFLRARAHDGEANAALIRVLSKYFGVAKGRIEILRGGKSRTKVISVV